MRLWRFFVFRDFLLGAWGSSIIIIGQEGLRAKVCVTQKGNEGRERRLRAGSLFSLVARRGFGPERRQITRCCSLIMTAAALTVGYMIDIYNYDEMAYVDEWYVHPDYHEAVG